MALKAWRIPRELLNFSPHQRPKEVGSGIREETQGQQWSFRNHLSYQTEYGGILPTLRSLFLYLRVAQDWLWWKFGCSKKKWWSTSLLWLPLLIYTHSPWNRVLSSQWASSTGWRCSAIICPACRGCLAPWAMVKTETKGQAPEDTLKGTEKKMSVVCVFGCWLVLACLFSKAREKEGVGLDG